VKFSLRFGDENPCVFDSNILRLFVKFSQRFGDENPCVFDSNISAFVCEIFSAIGVNFPAHFFCYTLCVFLYKFLELGGVYSPTVSLSITASFFP
jgi:hypothetical protein